MKRIFWGMLLIMIDLTIMNGVFYLDLLPDFLGVLLCLWGMAQLDDVWHESSYFSLAARQYTHCHDQVSTMHHRTNPVL